MKHLKTLQQAIKHFSDYDNCREFMIAVRWADGKVRCPYCSSEKVTYLAKARVYRCYGDHPKQKFSLKVGTVFEDSPIPLEKWLPAVWLLCNCKNGVSSYEIHRAIGVTQKSAWFMLHRIRLAMKNESFLKLGSGGGTVEADETYVGPNPMRMHRSRKNRLQAIANAVGKEHSRYVGKAIVMGMLDREMREVRAMVVPNIKRVTLQEKILNHIEAGAQVMTDESVAYQSALVNKYVHGVIDHTRGYVQGQIHTQGIDNFWALLKRSLRGTYVAVEPFHLDRYVDEQAFRYNNRGSKENPVHDGQRFGMVMSQIVGKRLTFAELTGKDAVGETQTQPF